MVALPGAGVKNQASTLTAPSKYGTIPLVDAFSPLSLTVSLPQRHDLQNG